MFEEQLWVLDAYEIKNLKHKFRIYISNEELEGAKLLEIIKQFN